MLLDPLLQSLFLRSLVTLTLKHLSWTVSAIEHDESGLGRFAVLSAEFWAGFVPRILIPETTGRVGTQISRTSTVDHIATSGRVCSET